MSKFILNIYCPDKKGIIATTTNFIHLNAGNILYIDQYVDRDNKLFFMRLECEFVNSGFSEEGFRLAFEKTVVNRFSLNYELYNLEYRPKIALFVSKYDHCLYDILARYEAKELQIDIPFILSNHNDLSGIADRFNLPFITFQLLKKPKKKRS